MNKRNRGRRNSPPVRRTWLPWLVAAAGLLLIGGGFLAFGRGGSDVPVVVAGAPRVSVVQDVFDYGQVKVNTPIETVFRVQNVGDQPLKILGTPEVELREGC
jgi:hypothetical protein